jgi:hypothetical protein
LRPNTTNEKRDLGDDAEADDAPMVAMVANDDDDAVFATTTTIGPSLRRGTCCRRTNSRHVVADAAPEVTSAPVPVVTLPDEKPVEFPVTRYEFDGADDAQPAPAAPQRRSKPQHPLSTQSARPPRSRWKKGGSHSIASTFVLK